MPTVKLSQAVVHKLPLPDDVAMLRARHGKASANAAIIYWDSLLPGFGVACQISLADGKAKVGAKTYAVQRKLAGKALRRTIDRVERIPLEDTPANGNTPRKPGARTRARELLAALGQGIDPLVTERAKRVEAERTDRRAFENTADEFITTYAKPRNRRWAETRRIFDVYALPKWRGRDIASITTTDVDALVATITKEHGPGMARSVFAQVRKIFNWAAAKAIVTASPITPGFAMAALQPPRRRDRVLDDAEIRALWQATESMKPAFGPLARVLLLTGQRRDEVAGMRWQDIDFDKRVWTIPREQYKTDREHAVPLSDAALAIIKAQPRLSETLVFSSRGGDTKIAGWSKFKETLDENMLAALRKEARALGKPNADGIELKPFVLHDLRRSAMSIMTRNGVDHFVADRVLGHVVAGIGRTYDLHSYLAEKRKAIDTLAAAIARIVEPPPPADNVVPLRKKPA